MLNIMKYKRNRIIIIFLSLILFFINNKDNSSENNNSEKKAKFLKINPFYDLFNSTIRQNTILVFEPNYYHYECTPGYSKYLVDLGYNVDLLINYSGIDSLCLFEEVQKLRIFFFNDLNQIKNCSKNLTFIMKKYDFIIVQTTDEKNKDIYNQLQLLRMNNSIFVFHYINYAKDNYSNFFGENRIWTLGNIYKGLQVNPHYFGNIKIKERNDKIRFFLTSTKKRNYKPLIESALKLKNENISFEIFVLGWKNHLNFHNIPKNIIDYFIFKYHVSYKELYEAVENSDYIIIPLDPKDKHDCHYKEFSVTGSIQLSYGFLKPAIINDEFGYFYFLNNKNSLII